VSSARDAQSVSQTSPSSKAIIVSEGAILISSREIVERCFCGMASAPPAGELLRAVCSVLAAVVSSAAYLAMSSSIVVWPLVNRYCIRSAPKATNSPTMPDASAATRATLCSCARRLRKTSLSSATAVRRGQKMLRAARPITIDEMATTSAPRPPPAGRRMAIAAAIAPDAVTVMTHWPPLPPRSRSSQAPESTTNHVRNAAGRLSAAERRAPMPSGRPKVQRNAACAATMPIARKGSSAAHVSIRLRVMMVTARQRSGLSAPLRGVR
jgi:hypothetical protein